MRDSVADCTTPGVHGTVVTAAVPRTTTGFHAIHKGGPDRPEASTPPKRYRTPPLAVKPNHARADGAVVGFAVMLDQACQAPSRRGAHTVW